MQVTVLQTGLDNDVESWDRFVLGHPMASAYHLTAWRQVIEASFGHRSYYLMARDSNERVKGVVPLVFLTSRLFGRFLVSLPFVNYGGLLSESPEAQTALLREAVVLAKELKASHIELRQQEPLDLEWPSRQHKVSLRLRLPGQYELVWKGFPSKLRSQIRRAQKEGMTVKIGGAELLEDFYDVFARTMRDLGTPVYGKNFFANVLETFPKEARIVTVYFRSKPVAAGIPYGFRNTLEIPWASADRRYKHLAANMLFYSSVLEYACQQEFETVDFGRSTPGTGPCRFKEQWGAKPVPLHWYYWLGAGSQFPELNPQNQKYSLAIKVWQKTPLAVTKIVGPHIVRNIP